VVGVSRDVVGVSKWVDVVAGAVSADEVAALIAIPPAKPAKATPLAAATARRARRAGCGSRLPSGRIAMSGG
jgi:hypothetical protein